MADTKKQWGGSLHQTFRLLPEPSSNLRPFLEADGLTSDELLAKLPYDKARAADPSKKGPDPKRYRDGKQVYQTAGLLFEGDEKRVHVTTLGHAVLRFLEFVNPQNALILARHAAYALAACQLRNPTGAGSQYDGAIEVWPFSFIWRAMLALEDKISSDELNRAMFKVRNEDDLCGAIETIREARAAGDITLLGDEVVTGAEKNDRIIPWIALASFGWTTISSKKAGSDYYEIVSKARPLLLEASRIRHKHREFADAKEYVSYLDRCAALPKDLR